MWVRGSRWICQDVSGGSGNVLLWLFGYYFNGFWWWRGGGYCGCDG